MGNYAWLTDLHLDCVSDEEVVQFVEKQRSLSLQGVFITGDISVGNQLIKHLALLERGFGCPIYFVLGNHDFYGVAIEDQRKAMKELCNMSSYLKYMNDTPYVSLTPTTALVGHDGWYDARNGTPLTGKVILNDWYKIREFWPHTGMPNVISRSQQLAHEATTSVMNSIKAAVRYATNIIILTHVPPFTDVAVYRGKPTEPDFLPWYTSKFMGDMLLDAAKAFPDKRFTVLCGHTHGGAAKQIAPNMIARCGEVTYGKPAVQDQIVVL